MNGRVIAAAGLGLLMIGIAWKPLLSPKEMPSNYFEIETPLGKIVVHLLDETPIHRDNFAKLASEGFYDGTTFHRIIRGFMIQGGDPNSKDDDPMNDGQGDPGYTLPAEIHPHLLHVRGALAAARQPDQVNPERRSSGSQFYIVHGRTWDSTEFARVEQNLMRMHPDFSYSDEAREQYATVGGAPFLDMQYTVFGEVVEGFDVLDAIANVDTPARHGQQGPLKDRPVETVAMSVRHLPDYKRAN